MPGGSVRSKEGNVSSTEAETEEGKSKICVFFPPVIWHKKIQSPGRGFEFSREKI